MCKLQLSKSVTEVSTRSTNRLTNYTDAEINDLFQLKWWQPVWRSRRRARKLFALGLSFEESKYLLQTKKLDVDEIVRCIGKFRLDVDLIKKITCSKETLLTDIPNVISMVGGVEYLRMLISKELSIENIKTLFKQLKLNYNDIISLVNCGYKVSEIETLVNSKFTCSELVDLARVINASEVYSLFKEERQNIVFLLSVRNILKGNIENLDSAIECYKTLYDSIPNCLYQSLIAISLSLPSTDNTADADLTYEDILIHYMDLAGGNIPVEAGIADAVPKLVIILEKVIKFFNSSYVKFIDDYIPVKPFILSAIWCSLDISLAKQYLKKTESVNLEVVGRSILSFVVSSMCGVTGYFHSGGVGLPFPNITSYINTYFNIQHFIKNHAPKVYNKIPQCLLFDTNQEFENIIKGKQISAGQGLSMVYTFRVGNAFLCSLLGTQIFSFESAKNIFKSLWPLPQEAESARMYFIYSGIPIYTKLNLKDVFVSIS